MQKQNNRGITLIALIITIIVMLILVGVSISVALSGVLFSTAKQAVDQTQIEKEKEQLWAAAMGAIGTDGKVDFNKLDNNLPHIFEKTGEKTYRSKISGNTYIVSDYGVITLVGETEEDAVGSMDSQHTITLSSLLPSDTYTLKYEDTNGVMTDYANICSLGSGESYDGFIEENTAPQTATKIGVYNSTGDRVGSIPFASTFKRDLGNKLYSFGAISDIHLPYETAVSDFQKAMIYFNGIEELLFTCICGDLTDVGSAAELAEYKSMVNTYANKPVYAVSGNHDATPVISYDSSDWTTYTGHNLWYTFTQGNDVYIMMGMRAYSSTQPFSTEELQWLYETLEANRNKRCFLFQHLFAWDGSGDEADVYGGGNLMNNTQGQVFLSLVSHYKNVIWFHGHSHQDFDTQEDYAMNNIDNIYGRYSVHIPSLAQPKDVVGNVANGLYDESEGYMVDVYENGIILRGRDFVRDTFLPIATYCLDTTIQTIEEGKYYDATGTISNKNTPELSLPSGTEYLLNQRYSRSGGGIIASAGFVSFMIPCNGDGNTTYTLQFKNTDLDLTSEANALYLLDNNKSYFGYINGAPNFSRMTEGVTTLANGSIQVEFTPAVGVSYVIVSLRAEMNVSVSVANIINYVITLDAKTHIYTTVTETVLTTFTDGYRLSVTDGSLKALSGATTTDFIDISNATSHLILNLSGIQWGATTQNQACAIVTYDSDKTIVSKGYLIVPYTSTDQSLKVSGETTNVTVELSGDWINKCTYLRVCGSGVGADASITISYETEI